MSSGATPASVGVGLDKMFAINLTSLRRLHLRLDRRLGWFSKPIQFAVIGGSGAAVDLTSMHLLLAWLPLGPARALAIWFAMTWNFLLNRRLTFAYARRHAIGRQYLLFCLSCLFGAVINWTTSLALLGVLDRSPSEAAAAGIVLGAVLNYFLCWMVAFGREQQLGQDSARPLSQLVAAIDNRSGAL